LVTSFKHVVCRLVWGGGKKTYVRGAQIFQTSTRHLKILGVRWVICKKFHNGGPQLLGTAVCNVVAKVTWRKTFVHPWLILL